MRRPPYLYRRVLHARRPLRPRRAGSWSLVLLAVAALAVLVLPRRATSCRRAAPPPPPESAAAGPATPAEIPPLRFGFPTAQTNLLATPTADVFMPTASGRPESALYGSVRTESLGRALYARFHEGIDIAPTARDRRNLPLDNVFATADGTVAYVNKIAGNSDYGRYVVLEHREPLGRILTLYAHLESIAAGIQRGATVHRGDVLGRMGHSPEAEIPLARGHTHFEIGLMANPYYDTWFRRQKLKPDHGLYNGGNLLSVNPLAVYEAQARGEPFRMQDYLQSLPVACELILRPRALPPYFRLYPRLWSGPAWQSGPLVVSLAEGGVPVRGRVATAEESAVLGRQSSAVLSADPDTLGRNGRRIVVRENGRWRLGKNGVRWVDQFTYTP